MSVCSRWGRLVSLEPGWVSGRPQAGFAKSWLEVALFLTGRGFSGGLRHHTLTLSRTGLQTAGCEEGSPLPSSPGFPARPPRPPLGQRAPAPY